MPAAPAVQPLGCLYYNYAYKSFIQGGSTVQQTPEACQSVCKNLAGCTGWTWWEPPKNECDIRAPGQTLAATTTVSGGAISGPPECPAQASSACTELPNAAFPGATDEASAAAWPDNTVPTEGQCWPVNYAGIPVACPVQKSTVLEDTALGWSGSCNGLQQKVLSLGETCRSSCLNNVLCSVWQEQHDTTPNGCWHGGFGTDCYVGRAGFTPASSQRIMHGTYRVLKDITGMQIMGLTPMFDATVFSAYTDGAAHCKLYCIANLGCQFWLYSRLSGCWVEDPSRARVHYPLTTDPSVSKSGTDAANAVVAGEYIQHYCGGDSISAGAEASAEATGRPVARPMVAFRTALAQPVLQGLKQLTVVDSSGFGVGDEIMIGEAEANKVSGLETRGTALLATPIAKASGFPTGTVVMVTRKASPSTWSVFPIAWELMWGIAALVVLAVAGGVAFMFCKQKSKASKNGRRREFETPSRPGSGYDDPPSSYDNGYDPGSAFEPPSQVTNGAEDVEQPLLNAGGSYVPAYTPTGGSYVPTLPQLQAPAAQWQPQYQSSFYQQGRLPLPGTQVVIPQYSQQMQARPRY